MGAYKWCNIIVLFSLLVISCNKIEETEETERQSDSNYIVMENGDSLFCTIHKYMSLQPVAQGQGGACYGDYFIQGYNKNEFITIYDLKEKKYLETLSIPEPSPSSKIHANTLNFGGQKYDEKDYFPLLYVSSGYKINNSFYIYVYRLKKDSKEEKGFSISLVQTISLSGFDGTWTEGVIDEENNFLWVVRYTGTGTGIVGYAKFNLPSIFDSEVEISYKDHIQEFILANEPKSNKQGHLLKNNRMLLVAGIPKEGQMLSFISINTQTEQRELNLDLREVGLHNYDVDNYFEPENLFFYNNQLMIGYRKVIYILDIQIVKNGVKSNYFS
jgi:hypothetical protein